MAVAPSQQRDATITTAGRSTSRTIRPMNPQVVAMAASAAAAVLELGPVPHPGEPRRWPPTVGELARPRSLERIMGFHHVALATRDTAATHAFYTEVMGFRLAKVVASPTPDDTGWSKHFFYDTGSKGMIAFWELHDDDDR